MYGMVNKAVEQLIVSQFGQEAWASVVAKANVDDDAFISNEAYPDEITYRLVGAASEVLNLSQREVLIAFGEWWVLRTARDSYGAMLDAAGDNLREFLMNLPHFHTRVKMLFPKLQPPSFACSDAGERSLRLDYISHREGLAPFVEGLIAGVGKMFDTPVRIEHVEEKAVGGAKDVFLIHW